MPSETSIANIAMRLTGTQPITSIDEDSDRARLAKSYFRDAVDQGLNEYPWKWALVRKTLSASTIPPEFGYKYQYLLPASCVRVFWVGKDDIQLSPTQPWERENDYIVTDIEAPLQIKFTCRRESYARMDQYLADVIGAALALAISQTLQGSDTGVDRMRAMYLDYLRTAKGHEQLWQNQETDSPKSGFEQAMGF